MKRSSLSLLNILLLSLLIVSCNLLSSKSTSYERRDPESVKLDIEGTVAALNNPDRNEDGVWSLLANLGIGVYTTDGNQIMPGSETSEASFWLYDFEIPMLSGMAGGEAVPFDQYFGLLAQNGLKASARELLSAYQAVYSSHPEEFLVQTFEEMGLRFNAELMLTPLQEWLLLLDTFVPPNGISRTQMSSHITGYLGGLTPSLIKQGSPCGEIRGGGIIPYWGLMYRENGEVSVAAIISAIENYYIIHGPLIASAAQPKIRASRDSGHEGHEGEGDRFEFTVNVQVQYAPWSSVPVAGVSCGALVDFNWEPLIGGMSSVPVKWEIPAVLSNHGVMKHSDVMTNEQGDAKFTIDLQHEEGDGLGPLQEESGYLQTYVNLQEGFLAAGIYDERLLAFVTSRLPLGPLPVTVSWHEACESFTVHFMEQMQNQMPMLNYNMVVDGPILVAIDASVEPSQIQGLETIPVTGGGTAGECSFNVTGYDTVTIKGMISSSVGDAPPIVHMSISHEMDIQMAGEGCFGGLLTPISMEGAELELVLRDGEKLVNDWDVGMISGRTVYELELQCEH